ncbi:unnamed protein product [Rotaria sordida]|uniref:Proteasome activator PA28 C-terminal domain-containing protein n=2 Tax=Rotaria sordida TaxID=392033 RepID=A0A819K214_9BILA|nr:unnamed protein product [Rotaria sordida]CAF3938589.1 unnamed protein product [Rotaria sordida]
MIYKSISYKHFGSRYSNNSPRIKNLNQKEIINIENSNLSNNYLNLIIQSVQNYLHDFIEIVEHLTVWLELEIPSYNDTNDFCIATQNEILDEIA